MNPIAKFIKENRKAAGLTQEEFAIRSGLGLRFVRELEQGKETVRMDKVNAALAMFDMQAVPGRKDDEYWTRSEPHMCTSGTPTLALFPKPTRGTPSSTTATTCAPGAQAPCR